MFEYIKEYFEKYKRFNLLTLSAGASLILGLLSFGGMYSLWPLLIPAFSSFVLSVIYEFEIYSQNLSRAFDKLFMGDYFEKQLPKYYLLHYFQKGEIKQIEMLKEKINTLEEAILLTPQEITQQLKKLQTQLERTKENQKKLAHQIKTVKNKTNTPEGAKALIAQRLARQNAAKQVKIIKDKIDTLEEAKALKPDEITQEIKNLQSKLEEAKDKTNNRLPFFKVYENALHRKDKTETDYLKKLFDEQINRGKTFKESESPYMRHAKSLHAFLHAPQANGAQSIYEEYQYNKNRRPWLIPALKAFAMITALSMGLYTTYLLVELFSLVPLLTAIPTVLLPVIIVPCSIIAGVAYGALTFNAVTNLAANNTLFVWVQTIRNKVNKEGWTAANITMAATVGFLSSLALILTVCSAGTCWAIVNQVPPLFAWMRRIPSFIMQSINPIIMWFAAFAFNIENTSGTLHEQFSPPAEEQPSWWEKLKTAYHNSIKYLREKENPLQWINPPRAILLLVLSLRDVLFAGHLVSIAVTTVRIPFLSQLFSSAAGFVGEYFEDKDYFSGGHVHSDDIDTLLYEDLAESQGHDHGKEDFPSWLVGQLARPFHHYSARWEAGFSTLNYDKKTYITYEESWERQRQAFLPEDETEKQGCCQPPRVYERPEEYCTLTSARRNLSFFTEAQASAHPSTPINQPNQEVTQENSVHLGCSVM